MVIGASGDPLSVRADLLVLPINAAGTVGSDAGRLLRTRYPLVWSAMIGDIAATNARAGSVIAVPAAAGPSFLGVIVRDRARDWARAADVSRGLRLVAELLRTRPRLRVVSIAPLVRDGDEWSAGYAQQFAERTLAGLVATIYLFRDQRPLTPVLATVQPHDERRARGIHDRRLDDIIGRAERS